ncbi:MAG: histone deacetylase family protein [Gammaproteobacteria bacterium]|nr:histone deacetylase family protein [Gammaproteobacteria bacterium]MBU0770559.1 histone deacetylase family protein [Gammaproteobacteria bacterium]MBU0857516.1 histone deacetylase family protein [Gammaproteobacteria bacterium]MBU1845192.1 histone deacetylase family protein [Gammaproteobacteria bacterium]
MKCALVTHADCLEHQPGPRHPESRARLEAVLEALAAGGLARTWQRVDAPRASREQLARVHHADYLDAVERAAPSSGVHALDADTVMSPGSLAAASRAAGAVVHAVDLVMSGRATAAFCATRPPGHHARAGDAMGFCIYGNAAIGVAHALASHGVERVAIADFDVHRGNGTESMFRRDARVLMADSFQHPYYPLGDFPERAGYVPMRLAAGDGAEAFRRHWRDTGLPALRAFRPQLLLVSAGFDAHVEDPLADVRLDASDYRWLTHELRDIAEASAQGRIVSTLEGGYRLDTLGGAVAAHLMALGDCGR